MLLEDIADLLVKDQLSGRMADKVHVLQNRRHRRYLQAPCLHKSIQAHRLEQKPPRRFRSQRTEKTTNHQEHIYRISRHPWTACPKIQFASQNIRLLDIQLRKIRRSAGKEPAIFLSQFLLLTRMDIQILLDRIDDLRRELGQLVDFIEKITEIGVWNRQNQVAYAIDIGYLPFCRTCCHVLLLVRF